ncbi:MAG: helix-hairpin-helix domain-containing protein [Bradymonadales bacterium]|nr:helix-hairpin-helix domain-containing protein [Bradymonadales bacterium]
MVRWYITLLWTALLGMTSGCEEQLLFEPDPFQRELVRTYARETGWADRAFGADLVCITTTRPLCLCDPERLDQIVNGLPNHLRLDLNSASREELIRLPGIGPRLAERILASRRDRPFACVEDLTRVEGIGPGRLAKLAHLVRVGAHEPDRSETREEPEVAEEAGGGERGVAPGTGAAPDRAERADRRERASRGERAQRISSSRGRHSRGRRGPREPSDDPGMAASGEANRFFQRIRDLVVAVVASSKIAVHDR